MSSPATHEGRMQCFPPFSGNSLPPPVSIRYQEDPFDPPCSLAILMKTTRPALLSRITFYEQLESRWMLAGPTGFEQEMLELINEMREAPEASLAQLINLPATNPARSGDPHIDAALVDSAVDGWALERQMRALPPAPPLAWNEVLATASRDYARVMIDAQQQRHDLPPLRSLVERVLVAAEHQRSEWTSFSVSENLFGGGQSVLHAHAALAIDWAGGGRGIQNPPGHRQTLMRADRDEIGIAVVRERVSDTIGPVDVTGPFVVVQNLAQRRPSENPFLLGVAHHDYNGDGRYNAGEGLRNVTITVTGVAGTETPEVNTTSAMWPSGAYQLRVPPGQYDVTFSGSGLDDVFLARNVNVVAETNRKVDLVDAEQIEFPTLNFNPVQQTVSEDAGTIRVWPTLSAPAPLDITVPYTVTGTAIQDVDFVVDSGVVVIPAGEWFTPITIRLLDDDVSDPAEEFTVSLGAPTNAVVGSDVDHVVSILDDDPLPSVSFERNGDVVNEDVGSVSITIGLSGTSERDVAIPFNVSGTARGNAADYSLDQRSLTIPAGSTAGQIRVQVTDEAIPEQSGDETIVLTIGDPQHATPGATRSYTLAIADNDSPRDWTNVANPLDINRDGFVTSNDVLVGINELNNRRLVDALGQFPDRSGYPDDFRPLYDYSGDGQLSAAADILPVINAINNSSNAEGEATEFSAGRSLRSVHTAPSDPFWAAVGDGKIVLVREFFSSESSGSSRPSWAEPRRSSTGFSLPNWPPELVWNQWSWE